MTDSLSSFGADSSIVQYSQGNWTQIDSGSTSHDPNATVVFNFNGTLITIDGDIHSGQLAQNPKVPLAYVLDGEDDLTFIYNVSLPTIYSSQELSQGPHTLAIRLLNENTTFSVSGGNITISQPESQPNNHHRTIAIVAGTLGGLVIVVVVLLALFLFNRRRHTSNNVPYALGPLQANLPATKEAFTSPKYSNHGLSFTQSTDSVNILPHVKAPHPPPLPDPYETPTKVRAKAPSRLKPAAPKDTSQ
ncbi:hypothetical protein B0H16DRAFT_1018209 [Mycena metata]|uniref:Uncharacterized protein n=1 Tax=Mycena metata TaxID=1033252 RepID=A0AAD7IJG3_9AGAR|nr:hypothetical protein B0H16DRAFT_1018209 [Mycena metata]